MKGIIAIITLTTVVSMVYLSADLIEGIIIKQSDRIAFYNSL